MIFGRTDLRISVSKAKFDEEADFEVHSAVARQKPRQISEKQKFRSKSFVENLFCVETRNIGNRLKRVLAKFCADPSHVRGVAKKNSPPIRRR